MHSVITYTHVCVIQFIDGIATHPLTFNIQTTLSIGPFELFYYMPMLNSASAYNWVR